LCYIEADVVCICFSVLNKSTLKDVVDKWFEEVKENAPTATILLIGNKSDLRDPKGSSTEVISDWARDVAKKLNAVGYFECFKN
jgi:GTPase SAR1 family protein